MTMPIEEAAKRRPYTTKERQGKRRRRFPAVRLTDVLESND
jgi:hypothetical protein